MKMQAAFWALLLFKTTISVPTTHMHRWTWEPPSLPASHTKGVNFEQPNSSKKRQTSIDEYALDITRVPSCIQLDLLVVVPAHVTSSVQNMALAARRCFATLPKPTILFRKAGLFICVFYFRISS